MKYNFNDSYVEMLEDMIRPGFGRQSGEIKEINGKTYQFSGEKQEWIPLSN